MYAEPKEHQSSKYLQHPHNVFGVVNTVTHWDINFLHLKISINFYNNVLYLFYLVTIVYKYDIFILILFKNCAEIITRSLHSLFVNLHLILIRCLLNTLF